MSGVCPFCRSVLLVGDIVTDLTSVIAMEMTDSQNKRGKVIALNCQNLDGRKVGVACQRGLTHRYLWRYLTKHMITMGKLGQHAISVLLKNMPAEKKHGWLSGGQRQLSQ